MFVLRMPVSIFFSDIANCAEELYIKGICQSKARTYVQAFGLAVSCFY